MSLADALEHLREAYRWGEDRVPADRLAALLAVLDRAGERRALSSAHTVVGVFGPTGSGKSSLVNVLSGTDAARVAARRPTTSEPLALVWGRQGSSELLDWLQVRRRGELPEGAARGRPPGTGRAVGAGSSDGNETARADGRDTAGESDPARGPAGQARGPWYRRLLRPFPTAAARKDRGRRAPARASAQVPPVVPGSTSAASPGLILLDLPDFDSTTAAHREIVERLTGQVDVLLWVVDPQKYADAALHHDFLAPLATHGTVTLLALNQADRLTRDEVGEVTASLGQILAAEGLPGVTVRPVSARTGEGVPDLVAAITSIAEGRAAATRRLEADATRAASELLPFTSPEPVAAPSAAATTALAAELGAAAGVPVVVDAVRASYRRDARASTGWPVTRWLGALRPDPLRRINLRRADLAPELRRSSLPVVHPARHATVLHALRVFGDSVGAGVGDPWHTSIRDAARTTSDDLTDALDTAVSRTDLETGRSGWWGIVSVLQWFALAVLGAGSGWLVVLAVLGFLQLPVVEVPRVQGFPVPTLLILGGALIGILLGVIAALLARWGAARRAGRVRRRLLDSCARVAEDVVVRPVVEEVERCNAFRAAVLAAGPPRTVAREPRPGR
nr:dynamin family protein [Arthrobacter sp. RIT-PI-e]